MERRAVPHGRGCAGGSPGGSGANPRALHGYRRPGPVRMVRAGRPRDGDPGAGASPMHVVDGAAHGLASASIHHWELDPIVIEPLAVIGGLYAAGVARLWGRAGVGRGISAWSA